MAKHKDGHREGSAVREKKEKKKSKKDKEADSSSRSHSTAMTAMTAMMAPQMMMRMQGMPPTAPGAWPMMMRMPMPVPPHAIVSTRPPLSATPSTFIGQAQGQAQGQAAQPATGRGGMFARRSKGPPALASQPSRPLEGNAASRSSSSSSSSSVVLAVTETPEQAVHPVQQPVPALSQDVPADAPHYPADSGSVITTLSAPERQLHMPVAPQTPTDAFDVPVPLPTTKVSQTALTPLVTVSGNAPPATLSDDEVEAFKPKPRPKLGQIAFKIEGAKEALVAAQERLQIQERAAAIRAKRQNMVDASTQTVRDPEQDGEIVTVWKLRRRGMESFPHFPKPDKKRKDAKVPMCVSFDDKPESEMPTTAPTGVHAPRKRQRSEVNVRQEKAQVGATTVLIDDGESPVAPPEGAALPGSDGHALSPAMRAMDDPYNVCAGDDAESALDGLPQVPAESAPATVSI